MKLILKTGLLAAMMFALVGPTTAHAIYGGNLPISGCNAGKAKCIIKMKSCQLGCWNKVLGKGGVVDQACLDKCRNGFLGDPAIGKGCVEKLDTKNAACGASLGTGPVLKSKIESHVNELVSSLAPVLPVAGNKCTAGKTKCVIKYNACVLGIVGKAFKAGGPIGSLDKCNALLVNNYLGNGKDSCIQKLETKYGVACQTLGDQGRLRAQDDAFVNDAIYNLLVGNANMNTKRCTCDTSVQCSTSADCPGACPCEFYFGSPLPLAAGGIASCVTSQWNGGISGTFNTNTGASAGTASVLSRVYTGSNSVTNPCPVCAGGNDIPNDGLSQGSCSTGPRAGMPCDANGESPTPSFGKTSLDCPPPLGTLVATLPVDLTNTNTGTVTATVTGASPGCNALPGQLCLCASCSGNSSIPCRNNAECALAGAGTCTNAAGTPRQPNACIDDTSTPGVSDCSAVAGGEGECQLGPVTQHCLIETFRGCTVNGDCPVQGDACGADNRECFAGYNGASGDTITAVGKHGTPHNNSGTSNFASIFCIAPTGNTAVNNAAGLPGPGRLELGGVATENGGVACPTQATFLPTAKGGVLDTGWTGLAHDASVVGQGMVTVSAACAGTPPNCSCTYSGPIANP